MVPPALWNILEVNNTFDKIDIPFTDVPANDDGSYSINMNMTQWQQFQDNMKEPVHVPIAIEEPKPAPQPAAEPKNEIAVTQKSSRFNVKLISPRGCVKAKYYLNGNPWQRCRLVEEVVPRSSDFLQWCLRSLCR